MDVRGIPSSIGQARESTLPGLPAAAPTGAKFSDLLSKLLTDVNQLQTEADDAAKNLATGSSEDLHRVMIALNRADLSMRFLVEVRNRALEAYQEIARLPV